MDNRQLANRVWPEHEFAEAIEAPAERKLIRNIILLITGSILIMLVWSVFTSVEEISKSKGQVVPLGHRQVIQSRAGGTIASVVVEEGDVVKQGDILASFVSIDSLSAEEELSSKRANLMMRIERYEAFIDARDANFDEFAYEYPQLVKLHQSSLNRMIDERVAIEQLSESEIAKSQAELDGLKTEIPPLSDQIQTAEQTLKMMLSVTEEQAVSKLRILESQQQLDSYMRELKAMESKQQVLTKNLLNLQQQLKQRQASLLKEVGEKRTDTQAELLGVTARLKSSSSLVSQNTVTAPVDGIIQSIPTSSTGSVIQPGGTVAVIVPMTKTGLMEIKLSPRDIGFVHVGQSARIKIDAFDYSRYGALDGIVKRISPSTDKDEKGGVFYKVQLAIDKPYFLDNPDSFALIPGMTGEADIVTGEKSVFQYLWKPVFTNINEAFGER
ncbi:MULTISPECIES: HlyD family type I secretion periplasmic adaptor subunit [unclassified Shewanella]|uniref:HlyD family type I secretion periplasmic adaptor subunit n=1 Tax=unclassified Shewanella TaxID=196818 RepID=UPI000C867282|nr:MULTISPECIES: HlyD family type I secretion periplasmic adaptor subunit [unclassified Shewanella]MDO6774651.1 HlyD family type I secretion periplasmic adaptor subunit [Shewanella sp. 3_MG-2023]PMG45281.1 secretion protein HylD [Shewanella sp. 10N.286.52.B9]